jgi:hypothetical protein
VTADELLDRLAPGEGWRPAWDDVLRRVDDAGPRRLPRRRLLVAAAVLIAIAVPLVAVAASQDWWFLRNPGKDFKPSRTPVVVEKGVWSGRRWELVAYPNAANGLCWGITPSASQATGNDAGLGCAPFVGFAKSKHSPALSITFLASSPSPSFPAYVAGPVVPGAETVAIRFGRETIRTPTVTAPRAIGDVRFYAVQVPDRLFPKPRGAFRPLRPPVTWVAGYDRDGRIVACLSTRVNRNGISPFSACR